MEREHNQELYLHEQTIQRGRKFEVFSEQLAEIMQRIDMADSLSDEDKRPILREISDSLYSLQKEYNISVQPDLDDIEYSMGERISEMEAASRQWSDELFYQEKTIYETDSVDTERLRFAAADLLKKYYALIEKSKTELQQQMEQSEQQRENIRKNISKRGG